MADAMPLIATSLWADLPFNPIKLILLAGWAYLCVCFVQATNFNPSIPVKYKTIANTAALFLGPLLPVLLAIKDIKAQGLPSFFKSLKEHSLKLSTKAAVMTGLKEEQIRLLDTSGRSLHEICGRSKEIHDSQILDLTRNIILNALKERASDILIDPQDESNYMIRFRVDGVLKPSCQIETKMCRAIVNSIKAVANMDIAERRRSQDGSFVAKTPNGSNSFRVASAGTLNGEKLALRILNKDASTHTLKNIGLSEKQKNTIEVASAKPSGMILVCGPTGSGKTTTLYGILNGMDIYTRNVITIEDPIEYVLPNASQIEVNPKADITFAKALRSILRQDPNVICVGEIRDEETASIALRASQTGHLVLATIHSDSNASALIRLLDLGVSALLISSGINLAISQRLLRLLCDECKVPASLTKTQIADFVKMKVDYRNIFQAKGCEHCRGTGYYGRTGIFDILVFDEKLKNDIANNTISITNLKQQGEHKGRSNLQKHGLQKVVMGLTSLEELKRVLG